MGKMRGSMTVFAAISMMLIAGFLFTLLEAARAQEIHKIARINSASVAESMFAGYEIPLWENYHLLGVSADGTKLEEGIRNLEDDMLTLSNDNMGPVALDNNRFQSNHLQMEASEITIEDYQLLTDCDGAVYQAAVASYMENNLLYETAKLIYSRYESVNELTENTSDCAITEDMALQAVDGKEPDGDVYIDKNLISQSGCATPVELDDNPLKLVQTAKSKGILSVLATDKEALSQVGVEKKNLLSHRELCVGTMQQKPDMDWYGEMLFYIYLNTCFSNYTSPMEGHAFAYEQEYLLFGEESDIENLKKTANLLLATREAANLAYLATDSDKKLLVEGIALAIAGESCNAIVVQVVQVALLAAWAYAESIMDVRALLQGKKIALMKSDQTWSSDIKNLSEVFSGDMAAIESEMGLSYNNYLQIFLLSKAKKQLAYRAMDLQELSICQLEGYGNFRMDHLIVDADISFCYRYHTIFMGMDSLTKDKKSYFSVQNQYRYSYWKAGE